MKLFLTFALFCVSIKTFGSVLLFNSQKDLKSNWSTLNDTVMGGRSSSRWISEPSFSFAGNLSLANNGGFASVRNNINNLDLSKTEGIHISVMGDGRKYQFRIRSRSFSWADYSYDFKTVNGVEQNFYLPYKDFESSWRGLSLGILPTLKGKDIIEIGFFLGDKKSGKFKLNISEVSATDEFAYSKMLKKSEMAKAVSSLNLHHKLDYTSLSKQFIIRFETLPNFTYLIEASNDSISWNELGEVQGNGNALDFIDTRKAVFNQQFYRVRLQE